MKQEDEIIGYDFQGWPICKQTLRDILIHLGAIANDNMIGFNIDNPILDLYPKVLQDDGMGYGINPQFITEAYHNMDSNIINLFAEPLTKPEEQDNG